MPPKSLKPSRGKSTGRCTSTRKATTSPTREDASESLASSSSSRAPSSEISASESSDDTRASSSAAPTAARLVFGLTPEQHQQSGGLTRLRLSRAHQLRRVLSQRHVAEAEVIDRGRTATSRPGGPAFFEHRECLSDADAALLMVFSNAAMFERLLGTIAESSNYGTPPPAVENVMVTANPVFAFNYTHVVPDVLPAPPDAREVGVAALTHAAQDDRGIAWRHGAAVIERRRPREVASSSTEGGPSPRSTKSEATGHDPSKAGATTGSLVARSMQSWNSHLSQELRAEGETVENYRHSKAKHSYLDKAAFQQEAQWNEFLHERKLEEEQREMANRRAVRRGQDKA